ncbi:MAG: 3-hydroxyacyl-CoA dehydrogenase family protein [Pseudomonadota bacterium]
MTPRAPGRADLTTTSPATGSSRDIRIGFLNDLLAPAERMMLSGVRPADIDQALVAAGWSVGPFEAEDLLGVHHGGEARRQAVGDRAGARRLIADRMIAEGRVGKIGGVGWYRYPGGGGAVIDPLIEDLIREEAHFARLDWREDRLDAEAIVRRLVPAAINAAYDAVERWRVSPETVDASLVSAPPFASPPGGFFTLARSYGAARCVEALDELADAAPADEAALWRPGSALRRAAA